MSALEAEGWGVQRLLAAWEGTLHGVAELGRRLTAEQWTAPTECPGWSVGDVVRHLAWVESFLAGRPQREVQVDWDSAPHVRSDFGRLTELGVEARRNQSLQECCDELAGLVDVRLAQLMALDPLALDTEVIGVFGTPVPFDRMIRMRTFDSWTHEQDIRRAVGLPANLASPGALVTAVQEVRTLAFMLSRNVEAPPGTTLRLTVTGPVAFERYAAVSDDGKGVDIDAVDDPTLTVSTDWETYARLVAGRLDVDDPDVLAKVELGGHPDAAHLAARIPAALGITP
jgi:uncharacterized protein (TIGR03083 family)